MNYDQIKLAYYSLLKEMKILEEENQKLRQKLDGISILEKKQQIVISNVVSDRNELLEYSPIIDSGEDKISRRSSPEQKIALYLSLFRGREDICAKQWSNGKGYSPNCANDWLNGVCPKTIKLKIKCAQCDEQNFIKLDASAIDKHLRGEHFLGIYPMTQDDRCYFVAIDFDEASWEGDLKAVWEACHLNGISAHAERSKSGNGGHLWFFFSEAVKASIARKFAMFMISEAMNLCKNIGFDSYDRLFPSQDFLQKDGFGNLIALPLNGYARKQNNTVFMDRCLKPIIDQWDYLGGIKKITVEQIQNLIKTRNESQYLSELTIEEDHYFREKNGKKGFTRESDLNKSDFPNETVIVKSTGFILKKELFSARAIKHFRRLASFGNPEFYSKQSMRMSTYNTPRVIGVFQETNTYLWLPRGVEEQLLELMNDYEVKVVMDDQTNFGKHIDVSFRGELRLEQKEALNKLVKNKNGVLSATTGFGKTVIGAALIAEKQVNTLILVHTRKLASQWIVRLGEFLDIHETIEELPIVKKGRKKKFQIIGQIGAGKNMVNGIIDVAIMQSLFYEKEVKPFVKDYGMVIVDECHHISASSFNKILNEIMATYVYGLSATPIRKDGHHPNIFMQCGPIRFRVDAKKQAEQHSFEHYVVPRFTSFRKPIYQDEKEWHISDVYRLLSEDQLRNQLILKDILDCISKGRTPIVLTERTAHAQLLSELLLSKGQNVITLTGKLSEKERSKIEDITHSFFDKGFNIMFHKDLTQKFIVIDNQLIWYGNLNMLGFQKDDDSAMRLINLEIAQELMQIVDGEE